MNRLVLGIGIGIGFSTLIRSLTLTASDYPAWEVLLKHQPDGLEVKCVRNCSFEALRYGCGAGVTGCVSRLNTHGISGTDDNFEVEWPPIEVSVEHGSSNQRVGDARTLRFEAPEILSGFVGPGPSNR
ncbi:MAG: hypothetical protein AAFY29_12360 [Pseudomonadota bacterium]